MDSVDVKLIELFRHRVGRDPLEDEMGLMNAVYILGIQDGGNMALEAMKAEFAEHDKVEERRVPGLPR